MRSYLQGRFENTAFCLLAPDGETRLTGSGRSPTQLFRTTEAFVEKLESIAAQYPAQGDLDDAALPDFHSFTLALNVASADQRLLLLVAGQAERLAKVEKRLRPLAWHADVQGKFHLDMESERTWQAPLSLSEEAAPGIYVIEPDTFGLTGVVLGKLSLDATPKDIRSILALANAKHAKAKKKDYSEHVREGRTKGKTIEMAMPFGEDRDGDGEIDHRGGLRR